MIEEVYASAVKREHLQRAVSQQLFGDRVQKTCMTAKMNEAARSVRFLRGAAVAAALTALGACPPARADEPRSKTDAAEKVGEGNAQRWLEYYRRERGQNWQPRDASVPPDAAAGQPPKDPAPAPADAKPSPRR